MIAHLHQHAVVGAAGQVPDAIGDLVGLHLDARLADIVGRLDIRWWVRSDFADRQVEGWEAALLLGDPGREPNTAKILVIAVDGLGQRVAEDRIGVPGFDFFDQVLVINHGPDLELALHGGVVLKGGLDQTLRRDPQLMQSIADGRGCGIDRTLAKLTPGQRTADRCRQALTAGDRQPAAARHWITLGPDHLIAQRRRLVIDRAGVALQPKPRPWVAGGEALAKREEGAAAGILQRLHLAQSFADAVERGFGVLAIAKTRCEGNRDEDEDRFLPHWPPPWFGSLDLNRPLARLFCRQS